MSVKIHDFQARARIEGAPWDEINQLVFGIQQAGASTGANPQQIAERMGFSDPKYLRDNMAIEAMIKAAENASKSTT